MYCKNCGIQIDNDSKFCTICGTKQQSVTIANEKITTNVSQPIQSKVPEIKNQVKKIQSFFGIPNSIIISYLIWFSIHLILLLVSRRDRNIGFYNDGPRFWPFSKHSDLNDYDFSEFFLYVLIPFIAIVIYGIIESSNNTKSDQNERYDNSYKKDTTPTIIGIIIIFINFIIIASGLKFEVEEYAIFSIFSLGLRIGITIWCVSIANKLNRGQTGWGLFAFFLPSIALISIGMQKKILCSRNYSMMTREAKSIENNNIAYRMAKEKKYIDAIAFSNKSIELNPNNHAVYHTRAYIKYFLKDYNGALEDINKSIELDDKHPIKFYHRGYIYKEIGKIEEAIKDWNIAAQMGYNDASTAIKNNSNIKSA